VRELREADGSGRPEGGVPEAEAVRGRAEARSPAEVRSPAEARSRGEYAAEVRFGLSLEIVGRFEPRRAGLPEVSIRDGAAYLDANQARWPWLAAARDRPPEVQRLFAALDQGRGRAHIRHEGWVTKEMNRRRLVYLEDPAQLDPAKRAGRIDGPVLFAVAIARGSEHPDVRTALDAEFDKRVPAPVVLPITGLLGPHGHRHCTGWQAEAVEGSVKTAAERRDAAKT